MALKFRCVSLNSNSFENERISDQTETILVNQLSSETRSVWGPKRKMLLNGCTEHERLHLGITITKLKSAILLYPSITGYIGPDAVTRTNLVTL